MKVQRIPTADAAGHLLAHNAHAGGKRILKKGVVLDGDAIAALQAAGLDAIWTARLEDGDVPEDAAADRISAAVAGAGVTASPAATGRTTLRAESTGVVRVDGLALVELNLLAGVALATVHDNNPAAAGEAVATLKIIPFALAEDVVARAEAIGAGVLRVDAIPQRPVAILVWGAAENRDALFEPFRAALAGRFAALNQPEVLAEYVALDSDPEAELAAAIARVTREVDLLILAGESAIIDLDDLVPAAVRRAGGEVMWLGAPVFPGNLLLLARRGHCAIVGAPGCARSKAFNVIDLLLPRMLAGETLGASELVGLGQGGLLTKQVR